MYVHVLPTELMATRIPRCHVLVRFLPRMLMLTFIASCLRAGFGWVAEFPGAEDTNTAGIFIMGPRVCEGGATKLGGTIALDPDGADLVTVCIKFCTCCEVL